MSVPINNLKTGFKKVVPKQQPAAPPKKVNTADAMRKAKLADRYKPPPPNPKTTVRPISQAALLASKLPSEPTKSVIKKAPVRKAVAIPSTSDSDDIETPPMRRPPVKPPTKPVVKGSGISARDNTRAPQRNEQKDVKVKPSQRKVEKFDPVVVVRHTKTFAQIQAEKLNKNTVDPEEYEKIKEKRIRDLEKQMNSERKVVKAKIVEKKQTRAEGDDETPYDCSYEEEEIESWESIEEDIKHIKEIDPREDAKRVKKSMAMLGRKMPSEKIKIQSDIDYEVEDLDDDNAFKGAKNGPQKKDKMPVVNLDNLGTIIKSDITQKSKRDILLVGLSESAKDTITDLLMETTLGKAGRIFDTSLEENETKHPPKTSIAMFSEKVPILPLDQREEDSSEEDGVKARTRANQKQKLAQKAAPKNTKKKVIANGEDRVVDEKFDVKKDYPSVRFIFLVKVSAHDRVDIKNLHYNVAPFTPLDKFKKKFTDLTRAECLIIDLENRNQIYHMEFA